MTTKKSTSLTQKHVVLLGLAVGAVIIGVSWVALMWSILAVRPSTNIFTFGKAESISSAIMIFAWVRAHRELARKGWGHGPFGSLGWLVAGALIAWIVLKFSWGFDIDAGDTSGIVTFAQANMAEMLFIGGWALAWILYIIGIITGDIETN